MHFRQIDTTSVLPVMEHFYTLQGEGFYSGRAAYFVRLAGCNVGCVWCDVKESWDVEEHPDLDLIELVEQIERFGANFVVITGGEPTLYDLTTLTQLLHEKNIEIAMETSGTYPLVGEIDWYCFSPKKFKAPLPEAYEKANELKVVVYHPSDIEWAEKHAALVNENCKLFLQPEWSRQDEWLPLIIDYVKRNPHWRISLQTHKFMQIP
jgi:7-carboxy-7-deazaguanine synthase